MNGGDAFLFVVPKCTMTETGINYGAGPSFDLGYHGSMNAPDEASELSSGSESIPDTGGDSGALGICTLCRKQCQLSALKCNKPYERASFR